LYTSRPLLFATKRVGYRKAASTRLVLDVFITKLSNPFRRRDEHAKRAEVHMGEGTAAASGLRTGRGQGAAAVRRAAERKQTRRG